MSRKYSYDESWLVLVIITCLLAFVTLEAGVFALLGMTSTVELLVPGYKALMAISIMSGSAMAVTFFYTRNLKRQGWDS
jgi:hypothetical protein